MGPVEKVVAIVLVLAVVVQPRTAEAVNSQLDIGVSYGLKGDNLPSPPNVIQLYKKYRIRKMRLFNPVPEVLAALKGSGIEVTLGVLNQDLQTLATGLDAARRWIDANVQPYVHDVEFRYITAGNEIIPGPMDPFILPAMQNLQKVVNGYGHAGIKVTTVIDTATLGTSYPPSAGAFSDASRATLAGILGFLSSNGSPLLVNVYPYYAYSSNPAQIRLDYAQLASSGPVVRDGSLSYSNMLDAQLDALYSAMEKLGASKVDLVVSESGWPSAGNGNLTTPELAATYNRNFAKKILRKAGTPKRPNSHLEGFIFAMFNENLKPAGIERNFGLFYPNATPVYQVF